MLYAILTLGSKCADVRLLLTATVQPDDGVRHASSVINITQAGLGAGATSQRLDHTKPARQGSQRTRCSLRPYTMWRSTRVGSEGFVPSKPCWKSSVNTRSSFGKRQNITCTRTNKVELLLIVELLLFRYRSLFSPTS